MFAVCGEALWDLFASEGSGSLAFDARIGGSPLNLAVGLRRLGLPASLLTGLSADRLGERIHAYLLQEQVGSDLLVRMDNPTTLSLVDVGSDGSPAYAFYGEGAADRSLTEAGLPELHDRFQVIHAGSYSLVVEPVGTALLSLLRRHAGQRLIALDPNVRLNVEPAIGRWRERLDAFVRTADLVKASEEDLGLLYPGADPLLVAEGWLQKGVGLAVVTRGAEGAVALGAFGRTEAPGQPIDIVDCVGAGDSFQAALLAGLAEMGAATPAGLGSLSQEQVNPLLALANQAAAHACARRGADLPRRAALADAFDRLAPT